MASLAGTQLKDTYESLLKLSDNDALTATYKEVTDGEGAGTNLYVGTGGNVGIGGTNPSTKLQVTDGYISTYHNINANTAGYGVQFFTNAGGSKNTIATIQPFQVGTTRSGNLLFSTSDNGAPTERMKITSGGDISFRDTSNNEAFYWDASAGSLGLGMQTPSAKLEVSGGAVQFNGGGIDATLGEAILFGNTSYPTVQKNRIRSSISASNTGNLLVLEAGNGTTGSYNDNQLVLRGDGNVGIGTDSPDAFTKLTVAGAMTLTGQNTGHGASRIKIGQDTTAISQIRFYGADASTAGILQFIGSSSDGTLGGERMRIDSSGNVGIGTVSPQAILNNFSTSARGIAIENGYPMIALSDTANSSFKSYIGTDSGELYVWNSATGPTVFATNNTERMRIDSSGNVVIAQSSSTGIANSIAHYTNNFMYVRGGTAGLALGDDAMATSVYMYDNSFMAFNTAGSEAMRIDSSGNLLIGTTATPTSSAGNIVIKNGTAPTGNATDGVILYAEDVSTSSELKVRDEAGNVTTLSPHNFSLIPDGASEPMAWAYYSERDGKKINVDMLKLARMVESLTGEKLVYEQ